MTARHERLRATVLDCYARELKAVAPGWRVYIMKARGKVAVGEQDAMNAAEIGRIRNNPVFQELERKRNSFTWSLFVIMLVIYGGFILVVAFDPAAVATPIGAGPFTVAFPVGLGVIAAAIILTAVYVIRANSEFDRLTREVVGQAERSSLQPAMKSGPLAGLAR